MAERVVVTGLGVVTSLGCRVDEFWENLCSAKSAITKIGSFDTSSLERHYGGEVKSFDPDRQYSLIAINKFPRTHQFAIAASKSALDDALIAGQKNIGIIFGSIVSGVEFIESRTKNYKNYPVYMATSNLSKAFGLKGSAFTLSGACASGNYALSLAYDRIKNGDEEIILAGAADYFALGTFIGLYRVFSLAPFKCQPFDKNRKGLIPAEGAGMLVLESLSSARRRGADIYAEVLGYGISADAYHALIPSGRGVFDCMKDAIKQCNISLQDVDYINAHGTGTVPNDRTECAAVKKLFGRKLYKKIPISSIKSMIGHAMGAASSIEAVSCCLSLKHDIIPPTINYEIPDPECDVDCVPNEKRRKKVKVLLNNAFGFGGINCSLVLAKYNQS